jgi:phosphate transport system permease protein
MAAVIANEFSEATEDLHVHALVEIGMVLFIITLFVNVLSRGLIWQMNRQPKPRTKVAASVPAAAGGAA